MAKIYLMRWKKLAFVHDWRRRRKTDVPNVKQANLYLDDALAATIIIHDLSPTKEVPINSYVPTVDVLKTTDSAAFAPVDPTPSDAAVLEPSFDSSDFGIPLTDIDEPKPGQLITEAKQTVIKETPDNDDDQFDSAISEEILATTDDATDAEDEQCDSVISDENVAAVEEDVFLEASDGSESGDASVQICTSPKASVNAKVDVFGVFSNGDASKSNCSSTNNKKPEPARLDDEEILEEIETQRKLLSALTISSAADVGARTRQRSEIAGLNDIFAKIIEKSRFYEADNKRKLRDLEKFRRHQWPEKLYITEIAEAKKVIMELEKEAVELNKSCGALKNEYGVQEREFALSVQLEDWERKEVDRLILEYSRIENEANILKRRLHEGEEHVGKLKGCNLFYSNLLNSTLRDAAVERLSKMELSNEAYALVQEISMMRSEQDFQVDELKSNIDKEFSASHRERFRNEFAKELQNVRKEHEELVNAHRTELQFWYERRLREVELLMKKRASNKNREIRELDILKKQMLDLRARCTNYEQQNLQLTNQIYSMRLQLQQEREKYKAILEQSDSTIADLSNERDELKLEFENLTKIKKDVQEEINEYQKLLNSAGSTTGSRLPIKTFRPSLTTTEIEEQTLNKDGETVKKTMQQQMSKGNVVIKEVAPDGSYVTVENVSGVTKESIGQWKIQRSGQPVETTNPSN